MNYLTRKAVIIGVVVVGLFVGVHGQDQRCHPDEHIMDPPECPEWEGFPTYYPYPYDCHKYFECSNGDAYCIQCAPGTAWDQSLQICNHESEVGCVIETTTTIRRTTTTPTTIPTTPPTTTTPTTTPPTTTTLSTTTDDPANWICPEGYEGPIGHPWTCTQFYICDPGQRPCLYDCPPPLYYSPVPQICDWPENVPECQGGTPPPPTRRPFLVFTHRNIQQLFSKAKQSQSQDPCEEPRFMFMSA